MTGKAGKPWGDPQGRGGGDDDSSLAAFAGVGLQFAITIIAFLFLGVWLDGRLGTSPWLTLAGVFVGAAAGFYSLYTRLMAHQRRVEERRKQ